MSFTDLKKEELLTVADTFGVEIDKRWGEENIRTAILDDGVTWGMWEDANRSASKEILEQNLGIEDLPDDNDIPAPRPEAMKKFKSRNAVELLKMERWNPAFNILGYRFTREHPFVLVKPEDADWIMSHEEGFRRASPDEAEEYYKQ